MRRPSWDWLALTAVTLPLLVLGWGASSPMPWDEGYYALQARWMLDQNDWWTPYWWQDPVFDRTIGAQWLMALSYRLFGYGNLQAHLPTLVGALTSVLLTYALGRCFLSRQTAWLAACSLALMPLWISYAHLATQDMLLLATELLGLYALVRSPEERSPLWAGLTGASIGLGFWFKGFMVVLPVMAVLLYLWIARRGLLSRGAFWWGVLLGWFPTLVWLGISLHHWGPEVLSELWTKLLVLSKVPTWRRPWPFYVVNMLGNAAPFSFLAPPGFLVLHRWFRQQKPELQDGQWLLLGYPALLLLLLSSFNTKTHYYALQLLPFLAFAAASGISRFVSLLEEQRWARVSTLALLGFLVWLLVGFGQEQHFLSSESWQQELHPNFNLTIHFGVGWLNLITTPFQWMAILTGLAAAAVCILVLPLRRWLPLTVLCMLWSSWLMAGQFGLLTNHAPSHEQALRQMNLRKVMASTTDFQGPLAEEMDHGHATAQKQAILLALGAPHLGERLAPGAIPTRLTWISPGPSVPPAGFEEAARLGQWRLLQPQAVHSLAPDQGDTRNRSAAE